MFDIIKSEDNRRTVLFTESADRISELFKKVRRQIAKDLAMPGFRPGKVPRSIIDKQYGNIIQAEVADSVRQRFTSRLIEKEDWILDDKDPEGKIELPVEGNAYSFEMTFSLFETPEPAAFDGMKIEIPSLDLEGAVEKTLESFREKMISFETVDRPAEDGDLVLLEASPAGNNEEKQKFSVRIGESQIGAGFDELVTGAVPDLEFSARMDRDAADEEQPPVHCFRVTEVKCPVLPELDDAFAEKAAGVKNLEELRSKIEESVRARYDQEIVYLKERSVIDSILKSNPFDPPEYMVENLYHDYMNRLGEDGPGEETTTAAKELALNKVREFLILRAVAEKEKIDIGDDMIKKETSPEESESSVRDRLRNKKAMELILDRADITEMKPQKNSETEAVEEDSPDSSWRWVQVEDTEPETCEETAGKGKS
ncbi:MAG: trigger factor [Candidatus Fermentibacteria bacterium]